MSRYPHLILAPMLHWASHLHYMKYHHSKGIWTAYISTAYCVLRTCLKALVSFRIPHDLSAIFFLQEITRLRCLSSCSYIRSHDARENRNSTCSMTPPPLGLNHDGKTIDLGMVPSVVPAGLRFSGDSLALLCGDARRPACDHSTAM